MAIHVTIDGEASDLHDTATLGALLRQLRPATVQVDASGGGRVVLASLQAQAIPATALEKRPRPVLPELQRIEAQAKELEALKERLQSQELELRLLREHQKRLHTLIERLD